MKPDLALFLGLHSGARSGSASRLVFPRADGSVEGRKSRDVFKSRVALEKFGVQVCFKDSAANFLVVWCKKVCASFGRLKQRS